MPVSKSLCGLPSALSVMVMAPVRVPVAVGVKVTLSVQKPAGGMVPGQSLVWAKSPLATMPMMFKALALALLSRIFSTALVVPTAWGAKVRLDGVKTRRGTSAMLIFATKPSVPPP